MQATTSTTSQLHHPHHRRRRYHHRHSRTSTSSYIAPSRAWRSPLPPPRPLVRVHRYVYRHRRSIVDDVFSTKRFRMRLWIQLSQCHRRRRQRRRRQPPHVSIEIYSLFFFNLSFDFLHSRSCGSDDIGIVVDRSFDEQMVRKRNKNNKPIPFSYCEHAGTTKRRMSISMCSLRMRNRATSCTAVPSLSCLANRKSDFYASDSVCLDVYRQSMLLFCSLSKETTFC
jgi:hypothetical protein